MNVNTDNMGPCGMNRVIATDRGLNYWARFDSLFEKKLGDTVDWVHALLHLEFEV